MNLAGLFPVWAYAIYNGTGPNGTPSVAAGSARVLSGDRPAVIVICENELDQTVMIRELSEWLSTRGHRRTA